jgi:hypothetical protein
VVTRIERQQAHVTNLARRRAVVLTRADVPLPRRLDVDLARRVRKAEDTWRKDWNYMKSGGREGWGSWENMPGSLMLFTCVTFVRDAAESTYAAKRGLPTCMGRSALRPLG